MFLAKDTINNTSYAKLDLPFVSSFQTVCCDPLI